MADLHISRHFKSQEYQQTVSLKVWNKLWLLHHYFTT